MASEPNSSRAPDNLRPALNGNGNTRVPYLMTSSSNTLSSCTTINKNTAILSLELGADTEGEPVPLSITSGKKMHLCISEINIQPTECHPSFSRTYKQTEQICVAPLFVILNCHLLSPTILMRPLNLPHLLLLKSVNSNRSKTKKKKSLIWC